jgi:diguanylate cyclase (GGDEF)-like protein
MVDIDYFKRFNDRYGHLAGDDCLRLVASVLSQCARRAGEVAARYGGEEFVLLLPGADAERACETAQKCLEKMQSEAVPHAASPVSQQVTFSIGVATLQPDFQSEASALVNAADVAMYRAKSAGRACYLVASSEDWGIEKDTPRSGFAELE